MLYVEGKCSRCIKCKNMHKNLNRIKTQRSTILRTQYKYKKAQQTRRLRKKVLLKVTFVKLNISIKLSFYD